MRPIGEVLSVPLTLHQPKATARSFELRASGELVASLEHQSAAGSLAVARAAGDSWTFKRVGFFAPVATARREGSPADLAVYKPGGCGREGEVLLAGGERLRFGSANFWGTRFALGDAEGRTLVTYGPEPEVHRLSDLFKAQAMVTVDPAASTRPDIALLILFGWYLVVLSHDDAAIVCVAVTAS